MKKTIEDQIKLEDEMRKSGAEKFLQAQRERMVKDPTATAGIGYINSKVLPQIKKEIKAYSLKSLKGKAGINARNIFKIREIIKVVKTKDFSDCPVDYDRISVALIAAFFDTIIANDKCAKPFLSVKIGAALEDEVIYSKHKYYHKGIHEIKIKNFKRVGSSYNNRRTNIINHTNKKGLHEKWSKLDKVEVGMVMLDIVKRALGDYVETTMTYSKKKSETHYKLSDEVLAWIEEFHIVISESVIQKRPSVIKPKDWTSYNSGGYETIEKPFLRNVEFSNEIADRNYGKLMQVTNDIQDTKWAIDNEMLDLLMKLNKKKMDITTEKGKVIWFVSSSIEDPIRPDKLDTLDNKSEEFKVLIRKYKNEVIKTIEENKSRMNKYIAQNTSLSIAQGYKDIDLYFPHQPDYRTRNYPIPTVLNPQSSDNSKCLLKFGNEVELTEDGMWWLGVNTANLFGYDDVAPDERNTWSIDNYHNIIKLVALNPIETMDIWVNADKPFMFVQSCKEYYRAMESITAGKIFMTSLPVQVDGKCNGLQHYALMMRDENIAPEVGLVPTDKPGDIYKLAARKAEEIIKSGLEAGTFSSTFPKNAKIKRNMTDLQMAISWNNYGIPRKISKKPVMTTVYGSKKYGIGQSIEKELGETTVVPEGDQGELSRFLANIFDNNMPFIIGRAGSAMQAMRQWVSVYCDYHNKKEGNHIPSLVWESPLGILISQKEQKKKRKNIKCRLDSKTIDIMVREPDAKSNFDILKMSNAICPNFIHAVDASHMALTILGCSSVGIKDYCMIHDSFGTHASNMDTMVHHLKEAAIEIHKKDLLQDFRDSIEQSLPEEYRIKLLPMPEKGTLDIEDLRDSEFFFL